MNRSHQSQPSQRIAIVEWAARIGAVTAEAIAMHEGCTVASGRARLLAAERSGLLARARPLADQPALFTATRAGLRAAGLTGIDPGRVSAANARHAVACAGAAAALERIYPDHHVMGERELRRQESAGGRPLASASLGFGEAGSRLLHRPDLVLWPTSPVRALPVAVEVELTVKAPRRLSAICRAWARARHLAGVLYLVTPEVSAPLGRAIEAAGAERAIAQVRLEALLGSASAGARQDGRTRSDEPAQASERTVPEGA